MEVRSCLEYGSEFTDHAAECRFCGQFRDMKKRDASDDGEEIAQQGYLDEIELPKEYIYIINREGE